MKIKIEHTTCTGCHACVAMCPKECITMEKDSLGFLRPNIDEDKCVECGYCLKTCEAVKRLPERTDREIFAAIHKKLDVRKSSSSGGVFSALSEQVIKENGVIVGAVYKEKMSVQHEFAETVEQRNAMRGSKYTYSLCDKQVFVRVKQLLDDGRTVMFTGTPCQNAALKVFLKVDYDNLILVDILCHGITAPTLYDDFIKKLEEKGKVVENINFRYTPDGNWHEPKTLVIYKDGTKRSGELENSYFRMFVRDYCLRESCYSCNYASFERVSDITLGDFWGIEKVYKNFDFSHGVSAVVINTEKGKRWFSKAMTELEILKCTEDDCTHEQLKGLPHKGRNIKFVEDYLTLGYDKLYKKYTVAPLSIQIREKLYRISVIKRIRDIAQFVLQNIKEKKI